MRKIFAETGKKQSEFMRENQQKGIPRYVSTVKLPLLSSLFRNAALMWNHLKFRFRSCVLVLDCDVAALDARLDRRVDAMIEVHPLRILNL